MNWLTDTILRWDGAPLANALKAQGGVSALLAQDAQVRYVTWVDSAKAGPRETVAVTDGTWPGIQRAGRPRNPDDFVAAASRLPWVDANGYLISCLRAVRPEQPALLAPAAKEGSASAGLELSLIESRVWGGNCLLGLPPDFRQTLISGQAKAVDTWNRLGRTAKWLNENQQLFGHPVVPTITQVVDTTGESAEFCNLMTRQIATPAVVAAHRIPPPAPDRILAVVAVGIADPAPPARAALLNHARAGASLVVETHGANPWWQTKELKLVRKEDDRDFHTLGKGQIIAYHTAVEDPSEFGLDVIDIVTHKRRALRIWDAPAVVGLITTPPTGAKVLVHLVNYGEPRDYDFPFRAQGVYLKATLLRPGKAPEEIKAVKRAATTEVRVPSLERVAIVALS